MSVKSVLVRLRGDNGDLNRALLGSAAASKVLEKNLDGADGSSRKLSDSLNTSNDRASMLVQSALALGPALVPIGAQAVPIVMGLATQMTFAGAAVGVTALAFHGLGKTLKSVNDYQLEPSVENFQKMQMELDKMGPAGRDFVMYLQKLRPQLQGLQDIAQAGLLPGVEDGIGSLMTRLPQVEDIIRTISSTLGDLAAEGGKSLAGPEWTDFFNYIETDAQPILSDMAKTAGNVALGIAHMVTNFGPLTREFSDGMLGVSRDFEKWSQGLSKSQGFEDFVNYIEATGPEVWQTLGALSQALLAIVEAAAPVGRYSLPIIEAIAKTLAVVAKSPAGPVLIATASGLSAVSRAVALYKTANGSALLDFMVKSDKFGSKNAIGIRAAAAGIGALALSMTDLDEKAGLSHTAMFAMLGTIAGPWGAAIGAGVGLTLDLAHANDELEHAIKGANDAARSGDMGERNSKLRALNDQIAESKNNVQDLKDLFRLSDHDGEGYFTNLGDAMKAVSNAVHGTGRDAQVAKRELVDAMHQGGGAADLFGETIGRTARQMRVASGAAKALSHALGELEGFFNKRAAYRAYEQSLDDLTGALKKNGHAFDVNNQKGRDNLELLDSVATNAISFAKQLKDPGNRADFLADFRKQLVEIKKTSPEAAAAVQKVLNKLDRSGLTVPKGHADVDTTRAQNKLNALNRSAEEFGRKKPTAKADVDQKPAQAKVRRLARDLDVFGRMNPKAELDANNNAAKAAMADINRILDGYGHTKKSAKVEVNAGQAISGINYVRALLAGLHDKTVTINTVRSTSYAAKRQGQADGLRDGGPVVGPGGPRDDLVPLWGSNGEFMVNAAATARHRAFLEHINAQKYANGGMIRPGGPSSRPSVAVSTGSLAGLRIEGRMDLDLDNSTGYIRGIVRDEVDADADYQHNRSPRV